MSHKKLLKKGQLIDGYWCSLYPEALNQVSVIKCNPNYPWRTEVNAEDGDTFMDPRACCLSPNLPAGLHETGAMLLGPAAAAAAAAAGLYNPVAPLLYPSPAVMIERLGPHILRSHVSTVQYKTIPNNDRIDLDSWQRKEVNEWGVDEVIGWLIAVAKQNKVPIEDMNMHRFADCTGPLMMLMTQQNFLERDTQFGALLYVEFRKLIGDDTNVLDDLMRIYREGEASTSTSNAPSVANAPAQNSPNSGIPIDSSAPETRLGNGNGNTVTAIKKDIEKSKSAGCKAGSGSQNSTTGGKEKKIVRRSRRRGGPEGENQRRKTSEAFATYQRQ